MSKTHKDVMKYFDKDQAKKRERKALLRFKTEHKRKDDKREQRFYNFTTWIERTAEKD